MCTDVNECDEGTHNCHENANCSEVMGGFNCTCNTGFTGNGTSCESNGKRHSYCTSRQKCNGHSELHFPIIDGGITVRSTS